MTPLQSAAALLGLTLLATVSVAHHNTAAVFDLEKEVTFSGVVTRYEFRNPHIYFYVTTESGEEWRIEAGPTAIMKRLGWTSDTLTEGNQIQFTGNPSRREGKKSAYFKSALVDDAPLPATRGQVAYEQLIEDSQDRSATAESLAGTWVTLLTQNSGWIDEPGVLSLTDAGQESIDSFDENTMSPVLDCTPVTAPASMAIPDTKRIEILDDVVRIGSEFNGVTRVATLEGAAADAPSVQGHSVATLDDNTLTVKTTDFVAHRMGIGYGLASSEQKTLVEKFVLGDDGKGLTYSFTLIDPVYLAEPFESQSSWAYRPDREFEALPCDLENSRLFLSE